MSKGKFSETQQIKKFDKWRVKESLHTTLIDGINEWKKQNYSSHEYSDQSTPGIPLDTTPLSKV